MLFLEKCLLAFIGIASGVTVAGGVFAFITMIGVVSRLAARTKTVKYLLLYENVVLLGGTIGNAVYIFANGLPGGTFILLLYGLFSGIFTGCLAMALAETLNVFPVFVKRIRLRYGLPWIVLLLALGKGLGSLYQLCTTM